jgi:hypothetical protein
MDFDMWDKGYKRSSLTPHTSHLTPHTSHIMPRKLHTAELQPFVADFKSSMYHSLRVELLAILK